MPSLIESSDQDEDSDSRAGGENGQGGRGGPGTLFDVFHWSEKDNVDDQRGNKKKLNQKRNNKLQLSERPPSESGSDAASLPSLASFRDDDMSVRSEVTDMQSVYEKGSVVTTDYHAMKKVISNIASCLYFN